MTRHLLISARDPGAAAHLGEVARLASSDPRWRVSVVAAPPADRVLRRLRVPHQTVRETGRALPEAAAGLIASLRPDVILAGLSGPDSGLDEALLHAARHLPRYLFQDYWGDLNSATPAGVRILCLDAEGVHQTRQRHGLPATAVGSPAHDAWPDPRLARARLRRRHRLKEAVPVIGLCDQPLWLVPGFAMALRRALQALPAGQLLVRPHPRSSRRDRLQLRRLLRGCGRAVGWSQHSPLPDFIAGCDLLLSAYSNCALDAVQCNARPGHPGTVAVNLLCQPGLHRHYQHSTGFSLTPLAAGGLALDATHAARLPWQLRQALSPSWRNRLRRTARRTLPRGSAAAALLRVLQRDLDA